MEISLLDYPSVFVPFLTAPEGSTVCTHAVSRMPLWSAPLKSIYCYSSPPSMSASQWAVQYMFWLMVRDALWGTGAMKTWNVNHHGPQHKNRRPQLPLHSSLFYFHFSSLPLSVFSTSLLSLCSSGWPGCCKLKETLMCSDICDSERGEEQNHCCCSVITVSNCGFLCD